jgi:hypothetical protein
MPFVKKQKRRDAVDLRWKYDFFAAFRQNVNRASAGFHSFINTEKMDVIL